MSEVSSVWLTRTLSVMQWSEVKMKRVKKVQVVTASVILWYFSAVHWSGEV